MTSREGERMFPTPPRPVEITFVSDCVRLCERPATASHIPPPDHGQGWGLYRECPNNLRVHWSRAPWTKNGGYQQRRGYRYTCLRNLHDQLRGSARGLWNTILCGSDESWFCYLRHHGQSNTTSVSSMTVIDGDNQFDVPRQCREHCQW